MFSGRSIAGIELAISDLPEIQLVRPMAWPEMLLAVVSTWVLFLLPSLPLSISLRSVNRHPMTVSMAATMYL